MAPPPMPVFIAGDLTLDNWNKDCDAAHEQNTSQAWLGLFDRFFQYRLDLRYLGPIRKLQTDGPNLGEGFTITAIQCMLIEFLAACRIGKTYRHYPPETEEFYFKSGKIFVDFLAAEPPFNVVFDEANSEDFYTNVRCALLHEARTRGGWTIWGSNGGKTPIEAKVVYRDDMQLAITAYIARYREEVANNSEMREKFLRKFTRVLTD